MIGELLNNPIMVLFWFTALICAIAVHEFSHAWAADRLGDPTPSLQGRLTLDPRAHLDPIGTLMILFAHFGWGKPVQFDPFNLQNPRRDAAIISVAGPVSNLSMATISAIIFQIITHFNIFPTPTLLLVGILATFLKIFIILNVNLAIFNLIPIHPLDGFKIVGGILPEEYARQWGELEPYGLIFMLFLIFPIFGGSSPILNFISPIINFIVNILLPTGKII
jgi:Zn-dependent protease